VCKQQTTAARCGDELPTTPVTMPAGLRSRPGPRRWTCAHRLRDMREASARFARSRGSPKPLAGKTTGLDKTTASDLVGAHALVFP